MLIKKKSEIPTSEITPKDLYFDRRKFMVAAGAVAKSAADGLTLLMAASGEVAINQHLYKDKMSYDPLRELTPVALIGIVPCVVVVAAALREEPG